MNMQKPTQPDDELEVTGEELSEDDSSIPEIEPDPIPKDDFLELPPLLSDEPTMETPPQDPSEPAELEHVKNLEYVEADPVAKFTMKRGDTYRLALGRNGKLPFLDLTLTHDGKIIVKNPKTKASGYNIFETIRIGRPLTQEELDEIGKFFMESEEAQRRRELELSPTGHSSQQDTLAIQPFKETPDITPLIAGSNWLRDILPEEAWPFLDKVHCEIKISKMSSEGTVDVAITDGKLMSIDLSTKEETIQRSTNGTFFTQIAAATEPLPPYVPPSEGLGLEDLDKVLLPQDQSTRPPLKTISYLDPPAIPVTPPLPQTPPISEPIPLKTRPRINYMETKGRIPIPPLGGQMEIPGNAANFIIKKELDRTEALIGGKIVRDESVIGPFDDDWCTVDLERDGIVIKTPVQEILENGKSKMKEQDVVLKSTYGRRIEVVGGHLIDRGSLSGKALPRPESITFDIRERLSHATEAIRKTQQPIGFSIDRTVDDAGNEIFLITNLGKDPLSLSKVMRMVSNRK